MLRILLVICIIAAAAPAATISLGIPAQPVFNNFDITVQAADLFSGVYAGDELLGFGFNVTITTPGILQFLGGTANTALFHDDSSLFPGTDVAGDAFPGVTTSPITLATLHFRVLAAGITNIGITSNLADPNQGLIYFGNDPVSLSATARITAAVPEPATLLLSLAGLWLFRRFRLPVSGPRP